MAPNQLHISDETLVINYQSTSDKAIVGELFKRHSLMCFAVCNKYFKNEDKAKDAAMAVFEKLFSDLQKHAPQNFKSWLYSVCKNYCLMQLRKPVVEVLVAEGQEKNEDFFMQFEGLLHQKGEGQEKEQKLQALESALEQLNPKQKVCIELFYLQQKSYSEVSEKTGYTTNEVKSYIQNGKRNLKNTLAQNGILFGWTIAIWILHTA